MLAMTAETMADASLVPCAQAGSPVSENAISIPPPPPGPLWLPQPGARMLSGGPRLENEQNTPRLAGLTSVAPTANTPRMAAGYSTASPVLPAAATTLMPCWRAAPTWFSRLLRSLGPGWVPDPRLRLTTVTGSIAACCSQYWIALVYSAKGNVL